MIKGLQVSWAFISLSPYMCLCDNAPLRLTDANDITVYHNWARAIFCLFEIPSDFYILLSQILKDYHNVI